MVLQVSRTLSNRAFILNMLNMCIGLGLLAKPYAIYSAGWYSIISIFMAFACISYVSVLIAKVILTAYHIPLDGSSGSDEQFRALAESSTEFEAIPLTDLDHDTEAQQDTEHEHRTTNRRLMINKSAYQILAEATLGVFGKYYVSLISFLFMFMMCVNCFITLFNLCSDIVELCTRSSTAAPTYLQGNYLFSYIFVSTLPLVFFTKWKQVTFAGMLSVASVSILVLTLFYIFGVTQYTFPSGYVPNHYFEDTKYANVAFENNAGYARQKLNTLERLLFSFVIFKVGIGGVSGLPQMVISLEDKSMTNIVRLIVISYAVVLLVSVSFGVCGALVYRDNADVLILNSMSIWPGDDLVIFVSVVKSINLWTSFAVCFFYLCDITEGALRIAPERKYYRFSLRFALLSMALLVAVVTRSELAVVSAITSSFGTLGGELLMPLLLYMGMFYAEMSTVSKGSHFVLILFAFVTAALVIYSTVNGLSI